MIVVTGATGQFGRLVVEGLLQKMPGAQIGISVREPQKAADFERRGVRVRRGDFADAATLGQAFEGAEQVLIVSVNKLGEEALEQHRTAIQAAKDTGAKRILYTAHQAASPSSEFVPARGHAATEALLQASGLPYVSLRNGFYAESALFQLGGLKESGKVMLPQDGPVSWTARADLAEVAVAALTQPELFDGISPPLTASETLDFAAVAQLASEHLGRPVERQIISDGEYQANLVAHGFPEAMAALLGSLYRASRAQEFAVVDPTLERVLGRTTTRMKTVLEGFLSAQ